MDNLKLYELLEIPYEIVVRLKSYALCRTIRGEDSLKDKLLRRDTWDDGIKELQKLLGDDPDGIKILWELLNIVSSYSYEEYKKKKIPDSIFAATMRFCTRFLYDHKQTYGRYKFVWAWWFPRQISLNEFRIGSLEYEFVENEGKSIAIHIPSDADLRRESVLRSVEDFYAFRYTYFPEWEKADLVCDSWMLTPVLKDLLAEGSNILDFQNLFEIDSVDYDAMWFMDWIFPGYESIDENLPERTSLQRKIKKYLLEGKKVGCARGHLRQGECVNC